MNKDEYIILSRPIVLKNDAENTIVAHYRDWRVGQPY